VQNIIDINGKERQAASLKLISHQVPDKVNEGEMINQEFVEADIVGQSRTWIEWYPAEQFKEDNPGALYLL
jgi:hypothetical protein